MCTVLASAAFSSSQDAPDGRSCSADYVIRASVDADSKRLDGELTLTWTNRTQDTVSDLWFHLYHNAFSNTQSTHLLEGKGLLRRGERIGQSEWGWQQVTSIVDSRSGTELIDGLTFRLTDGGNESDRTVFSVALGEPVPAGASIEVHLAWQSQIPRVRRRTGYKDGFLFMAHWFPKLGVYEGGRGWNCHQFHRDTEFYADYGTYDVTLDLPEIYNEKISASGVQVGQAKTNGGRVEVRFVAPSHGDQAYTDPATAGTTKLPPRVHGFAWTASPNYAVYTRTFRYDDWKRRYEDEVRSVASALGRTPDDIRLRDVEVQVMVQSEREEQWERHFEATCAALFFYGIWWGEYPYEKITVVDPAWGARAAGGMEYPTLFTCGTQLYTEPEMHRPESVTVHEAGHQFWYGLVGNNEFEAAWMDEGFNSYSDSETLFHHFGLSRSATWYSRIPVWGTRPAPLPAGGPIADLLTGKRWRIPSFHQSQPAFELQPLALPGFIEWWRDQPRLSFVEEYTDPRWNDRVRYLSDPDTDPIETIAFEYADRQSYSTNSYARTAAALRSIAGVVGRDAFLRGMRHYSETWRYRHPYPEDFYSAFNAGAGVDISWYFDDVFRGTGTVDWSVEVEQTKVAELQGMVQQDDGTFALTGYDDDEEDQEEDAEEPDEDDDDPDRRYAYDVLVRRDGTLRLPVRIVVMFEGDHREEFEWTREQQATATWWKLPLESSPEKIESVVIDPDRLYYLDRNMSDNQWFAESSGAVPVRWSERVFTQYAHVLHWFASTGG
ncbi:MAG: M1 family metallopeptidase [bacterium]|nr:M1 family metallopeptidase [bacterium]